MATFPIVLLEVFASSPFVADLAVAMLNQSTYPTRTLRLRSNHGSNNMGNFISPLAFYVPDD